MKILNKLTLLLCAFVGGCTGVPRGVEPVDDFDLERYLGRWYEIARLDHSFERGLSRVTADYSLSENGRVAVVNRGYRASSDEWKSVTGTARFAGAPTRGHLLVSFFPPFSASYVIVELDRNHYHYALVCGPNRDFLWILSREPELDPLIMERLMVRAADLGFAVGELLVVHHADH